MHVVLRVTREVGNLRTRHAYRAIRAAIANCAARTDDRVVHASIQSNHVHLLVEADDKHALMRGMQGFAISAAKRLNRELRRKRGDVFPADRSVLERRAILGLGDAARLHAAQ